MSQSKFQFRNLLLDPYRLFFFLGSLYAIVAVGFWFTWLHALDSSLVLFDWLEVPNYIHSHVMIYGVVGFYVFGFALTAFPRFVGQAPVSPLVIFLFGTSLALAQLFLIFGTVLNSAWMMPAAIFECLSYLGLLLLLTRLYLKSKDPDKHRQPVFVLIALFFGTLGVFLAYAYYAFETNARFYQLSIEFGAYGFLLLLVVSITYRIVPFFTGRIIPDYIRRQGRYTLEIVFSLIALRLLIVSFFETALLRNNILWGLNLLLFFVLAWEWSRWIPKKISRVPILFVLYLGLSWILVFLGFSAYELFVHLTRPEVSVFPLLYTPALHALFIGCFGTLLLGISTRVVRGHGGLPIVADKYMLVSLILIQLATLLRVVIPLLGGYWPELIGRNYWAGLFWCGAFIIWVVRYLPILGRPKVAAPSIPKLP